MTKKTEATKQREVGKSNIEVMKFPETPGEILLEMITVWPKTTGRLKSVNVPFLSMFAYLKNTTFNN